MQQSDSSTLASRTSSSGGGESFSSVSTIVATKGQGDNTAIVSSTTGLAKRHLPSTTSGYGTSPSSSASSSTNAMDGVRILTFFIFFDSVVIGFFQLSMIQRPSGMDTSGHSLGITGYGSGRATGNLPSPTVDAIRYYIFQEMMGKSLF